MNSRKSVISGVRATVFLLLVALLAGCSSSDLKKVITEINLQTTERGIEDVTVIGIRENSFSEKEIKKILLAATERFKEVTPIPLFVEQYSDALDYYLCARLPGLISDAFLALLVEFYFDTGKIELDEFERLSDMDISGIAIDVRISECPPAPPYFEEEVVHIALKEFDSPWDLAMETVGIISAGNFDENEIRAFTQEEIEILLQAGLNRITNFEIYFEYLSTVSVYVSETSSEQISQDTWNAMASVWKANVAEHYGLERTDSSVWQGELEQHYNHELTRPSDNADTSSSAHQLEEPAIEGNPCPAELEGFGENFTAPRRGLYCIDRIWQGVSVIDDTDLLVQTEPPPIVSESYQTNRIDDLPPAGDGCHWAEGFSQVEFNIHSDSSESSKLLGTIPAYSEAFMFEACGGKGWIRVDFDGIFGWIYLTPGEILID